MSTNKIQIGGEHYKSNYQHWDFSVDVGMMGIDHTLTKYVSRWRKKNGLQDLQKAKHCCDKMIELLATNRLTTITRTASSIRMAELFIAANGLLDPHETRIMRLCSSGYSLNKYHVIRDAIDELIKEATLAEKGA
jgi:hypothetical protein